MISQIDCLLSFATIASEYGYACPVVDDSTDLEIIDGRHPVIERRMSVGEQYIPNSLTLNRENQQIIMITGPNMSGKSALLRQTALICLMAQVGSYVPASSARIGIIDKIFTRVGASDNISGGESTFMVEMNETSNILNNITERSLVILDEIGRGTSTYDGISIAWAISEFLHNSSQHPKTLFATHYHELNEMADSFPRIRNFNVSVQQQGGHVIFTRRLEAGGSNHSFGIHVARLAGMPSRVVRRAEQILSSLEKNNPTSAFASSAAGKGSSSKKTTENPFDSPMQMSFFQLDDPTLLNIKDQLQNIDINILTPVEAFVKLS